MMRSSLLAAALVVGLAVTAYGCFGDVYGGTAPLGEDCEYGCEMDQEEGPHPVRTTTASTSGSGGGLGGGGTGGSGGAESGGHAGTGGEAGAGDAGGAGGGGGSVGGGQGSG